MLCSFATVELDHHLNILVQCLKKEYKKALLKVVERQRFALRSHIKGGLAKDLDLDHPVGCDSVSYCRQGIVMNRKVRREG